MSIDVLMIQKLLKVYDLQDSTRIVDYTLLGSSMSVLVEDVYIPSEVTSILWRRWLILVYPHMTVGVYSLDLG